MSELENDVKQLKEQVKKLQTLLASTGQQVMQLQMFNHRQQIDDIGTKTQDLHSMVPASASAATPSAGRKSDYVTESDLGDMVFELQGQLTLLDQRSIRRTLNARSKGKLLPLPNADGEYHKDFPASLEALQKLDNNQLFEQWNHFEMLPNGETLDDLLDKEVSVTAKTGNEKMMDEMYVSFAQNVGINPDEFPRKN